MHRTRRLVLASVLFAAAACRSAGPTVAPAPPLAPGTGTPAAAPARPVPEAIRWARGAAEHRALFLQVYAMATRRVEQEAATRAEGTWAVVLDADETVLDNSTYQLERARLGLPFDAASWHAWTARREATPLPGAAAFLSRVRGLGGKIAIVTNRTVSECPDTEAVFRAHALPYDAMLCKPDAGPSDKNPRFEAVAHGTTGAGLPPLEIVAFLGDNVYDFPGLSQALRTQGDEAFAEFGRRFFVLPNAMYGSWERN
ncbi:MAG: 5'-nucleotidase, lipoprotein e(P4) family [Betaproteobacteria bacterium]